ncbi:helix-turn-helix transcriptional regulator [Iamia sp. SCSIO 61187]|uniref:PadR family transcriptional regulator n=1 Tax=Iamia sp. SCSIO 61187 TaxID=2722752 RepID=UPI001C62EF28|nr:PadR family transcriptional regulator [Iamia sp. SCSIO 61187]QYG95169.1 helix-turn-helix transcriptional regulator [Iamia sp. SCSIO 61187]
MRNADHHPHPHPAWTGDGPGSRRRGRGRRGGPGGFSGPGGSRGGNRRARRGDVRAAILALLTERPMHGYEIIGELEQRTEGAWRPSPGSVYPTLQMLEEEGLVTPDETEGRRRFALTDEGRAEADGREGPTPWEALLESSDPDGANLREAFASTAHAMKQVARVGTPAQHAKAAEILTEARRRLYEVLASDED